MLDFGSEDIDGTDDDADEERGQNTPFIGRWTTASSYDVYMVDTPKETNNDEKEDPVKDKPPETQPQHGRQRRRSKSRRIKDNNTDTGENNTPDEAEYNENPLEVTSEQDEREDVHVSPDEQDIHEDSEDSNYLPLSEEEESFINKEFCRMWGSDKTLKVRTLGCTGSSFPPTNPRPSSLRSHGRTRRTHNTQGT